MTDTLIHYYEKIFASEGTDAAAQQEVIDNVQHRVSSSMNETLLGAYLDDEIKKALFQMHSSKSTGLDGMSPFFYHKYWNIVHQDVCLAGNNFLTTRYIVSS